MPWPALSKHSTHAAAVLIAAWREPGTHHTHRTVVGYSCSILDGNITVSIATAQLYRSLNCNFEGTQALTTLLLRAKFCM